MSHYHLLKQIGDNQGVCLCLSKEDKGNQFLEITQCSIVTFCMYQHLYIPTGISGLGDKITILWKSTKQYDSSSILQNVVPLTTWGRSTNKQSYFLICIALIYKLSLILILIMILSPVHLPQDSFSREDNMDAMKR